MDGATALEFVRIDDQSMRLHLAYGSLAVRIRTTDDPDPIQKKAAAAHWCVFGSPAYLARRGAPAHERALRDHHVPFARIGTVVAGDPGHVVVRGALAA